MTHEELTVSYAIIRHNVRTYRSGGVVEVVKGKHVAKSAVQKLEACQDSSDRHEGWRYFSERSDQQPGIDPAKATQQRQVALEVREAEAMRGEKASVIVAHFQR